MSEIINIEGDIFYFENDLIHRTDGPAIMFKSGVMYWFQNGKVHRENGPAIIDKSYKEYWINDQRATDEEIKNIKRNYWIGKML